MTEPLDLLVTNVRVVHHDRPEAQRADIGVAGGKIVRVAPGIDPASATSVVDGGGKLAFPGVVDAHQHWGIYNPLPPRAARARRAA
jgi:allantoinase